MEKPSAGLRRRIVDFLWENPNPITAQCPPGHNTRIAICYSFKPAKRQRSPVSVLLCGKKAEAATADQKEINTMITRFLRERSDMIMSKCPPGYVLAVEVSYKYTPTPIEIRVAVDYNDAVSDGAMEQWIAQRKKVKLAPSSEPFTDEHFEALAALRLTKRDRRFIEYFRDNKNRPMSLQELRIAFSQVSVCITSINKICFIQDLWLQCRQTYPVQNGEPAKFQFVVMEEARQQSRSSYRGRNRTLIDLVHERI